MEKSESTPIFYEALEVGRVFPSGFVDVTEEEIVTFARRYDPQPFHLDPVAAEKSVFGGLVASGWLTASLTMRLMVTSGFSFRRGVIGMGVESLRWPAPVRPGDRLTASVEILSLRPSQSKPQFGIGQVKTTTLNQRGETVQVVVSNVLVPRRPK
jgi:acyl dehydratase